MIKQNLTNDFLSNVYYYESKTKTKMDQVCEETTLFFILLLIPLRW